MKKKKNTEINLHELINLNSGCDVIIFEGFKKIDNLKKIEVSLKQNNKEPLYNTIKNVKLFITDDNESHPIKTLNHNQIDLIAGEILNEKL